MKQKKLLIGGFLSLLLVLGLLFAARSVSRFGQVKIVVSGTPGLPFTGSCMGTDAEGRPLSQNLSGVVPQEFLVDARCLDFRLQRKQGTGNLDVTVRRSGSEIKIVSAGGVQGKVGRMEISAQAF